MRQHKYTCANCESEKEPYFSRSEPMGFYCADCGRNFDVRDLQDAKATADFWIQKAKHADETAADLKAEVADTKRKWKAETEEQARLLGMSAERECDLRGKIDRLERDLENRRNLFKLQEHLMDELKKQLAAERAIADRLHGVLDSVDFRLAFVENKANGSISEDIAKMRSIIFPALNAWKEARNLQ